MTDPKIRKGFVRLRIKRFGDQFSTCGIGIMPPDNLKGDPSMKRRCPKLVPGQVIDVPQDHPLTRQTKHVEQVYELEFDEILRPWVFKTAEAAAMANPSKSRLGAEAIQSGLALSEGAVDNQRKKAKERRVKREEYLDDPDDEPRFSHPLYEEDEPDLPFDEDYVEDEKQVAARANNRVKRSVKDNAKLVEDDEPAPAPAKPAPRRRRKTVD